MAIEAASWVGQPRIKGSTESVRMFLLTFSMIGLQFAWGTEVRSTTKTVASDGISDREHLDDLLYAIPTLSWHVQEQDEPRVDRRTIVWSYNTADYWDDVG